MSTKYIGFVIKKDRKFSGSSSNRKHLTNSAKHILRQHKDPSKIKTPTFDQEKSTDNVIILSQMLANETANTTAQRMIDEAGIKTRNSQEIIAFETIIAIPTEFLNDKEKLKIFEEKTKEFLETTPGYQGNVILAAAHYDEKQPHIQILTCPRDLEAKKMGFTKFFGSEKGQKNFGKGGEKIDALHDRVQEIIGVHLGLERGDGSHTNGLTNQQYQKAIKQTAQLIETEPSPPKPSPDINPILHPIKAIEKRIDDKKEQERYNKRLLRFTRQQPIRTALGLKEKKENEELKKKNKRLTNKIRYQRNSMMQVFGTETPTPEQIQSVIDIRKQAEIKKTLDKITPMTKEELKAATSLQKPLPQQPTKDRDLGGFSL